MTRLTSFVLISCFCVLLTGELAADEAPSIEEKEEPSLTLQVDPLTTYLGYVHLQVETKLNSSFSVYVGPHLRLFSPPTSDPEDYTGLGGEVGLRWYFFDTGLEGWWALTRGVAARVFTSDEAAFGGYVSGLVGYTAIFDEWFVLSGGAGVQYIHYRVGELGPKGIFPALHTAVGVAF